MYQPMEILLLLAGVCTVADTFIPSLISVPKVTERRESRKEPKGGNQGRKQRGGIKEGSKGGCLQHVREESIQRRILKAGVWRLSMRGLSQALAPSPCRGGAHLHPRLHMPRLPTPAGYCDARGEHRHVDQLHRGLQCRPAEPQVALLQGAGMAGVNGVAGKGANSEQV